MTISTKILTITSYVITNLTAVNYAAITYKLK